MSCSQTNSDTDQDTSSYPNSDNYENQIKFIWQNIQKAKQIQSTGNPNNEVRRKIKTNHRKQLDSSSPNRQHPLNKKNSIKMQGIQEKQIKEKKYKYFGQKEEEKFLENQKMGFNDNKLNDLEQKLEKSKENTSILMKKLLEAEEQIEYLEYELQKQMVQKDKLLLDLYANNKLSEEKQNRLANMNPNNDYPFRGTDAATDTLKLRLRAAQNQIEHKNQRILFLQNEIANLSLHNNLRQNTHNSHQQKLYFKGSELLELNEAYKTIQRLVYLLRSTDQFRLLGNFAEQIKSIHFLSKIPKIIKSQLSSIKINSKKKQRIPLPTCYNCKEIRINERLLWSPLLCYKKMLEMKMKHETLNEDCIEEVLFEMNKLYLSKEETRVNKLKAYYQSEIQKLKKKTQLTYDEFLAKKQIQRLKKQIQTSKNKNRCSKLPNKKQPQLSSESTQRKYSNISYSQSLKVIGQYEDELRLKQKQIKLLTERIKLLEGEASSYDKSLYMEGAIWIIDKVLEELENNGEDIREFEANFRTKMTNATCTEDWIRLFKQFFESVEELNQFLMEKILRIQQNTIHKINLGKIS